MFKRSGPTPPGGGGSLPHEPPQVELECVFTFKFNLRVSRFNLKYSGCNPVLGSSGSTFGTTFPTSRLSLGGPSCMFMPSLFFVNAASSFVSITRDISECELGPGSGKSGKKYSNKRRIYKGSLPRKS